MKRDGFCKSLWQQLPAYEPAEQLPAKKADVVIVGGGITGLTTALILQKAGKQCILCEANNIGFGTTGGTTAHLNTSLDTPYYQIEKDFGADSAQLVAQVTLNAIEIIKRNIAQYNIACEFSEASAFIFSQNEEQNKELEAIMESCNKVGVHSAYVKDIPVPISFTKAIEVVKQAQFNPTQYIYGLAKAFEQAGGVLVQECRVTDVQSSDGKAQVTTSKGQIKAANVVYATHIPPGVNVLHFRCAPYRTYAMAVKLKDEKYPDSMVYDMDEPYHYYRTHIIGGEKYLIAGGEDHKTGHEENTQLCFNRLESYLRKHFDIADIPYHWSSQYFEPADGLPYIGHLPGNPANVFVATGFGGNGMIYGTASGMILSDLIISGKSQYKDLFSPGRVKPMAELDNVIKESADVAKEMLTGWLYIDKIEAMAELAKGEAKVIKYEGDYIALYKEESGKLHAVNPACPHIKCSVAWNTAEKSWDCPCHGSRFSFTGAMLTAPSRKDLTVIDLKEER